MSVHSEPALDFSPQPPSQCPGPSSVHTLTQTQTRPWLCAQGPQHKPPVGTWPAGVRAVVARRGSGPDLPVRPQERETACESSAERNRDLSSDTHVVFWKVTFMSLK